MSARPASSWEHASGASAMGYSGGNKQLPSYQGAITHGLSEAAIYFERAAELETAPAMKALAIKRAEKCRSEAEAMEVAEAVAKEMAVAEARANQGASLIIAPWANAAADALLAEEESEKAEATGSSSKGHGKKGKGKGKGKKGKGKK